MKPLDPEEEHQWMDGLREFDDQNRNILMAVFSIFGLPASYLDVGCGSGVMVRTARSLGVESFGIDQLHHPENYFFQHNLEEPFMDDLKRYFHLVTSLETAEHISPEGADNIADTIAYRVAQGGTLVFTAAMPGQPGHHHVNLQSAEYWRRKFDQRGLHYNASQTYRLALAWSITRQSQHHLEANLQVFER